MLHVDVDSRTWYNITYCENNENKCDNIFASNNDLGCRTSSYYQTAHQQTIIGTEELEFFKVNSQESMP